MPGLAAVLIGATACGGGGGDKKDATETAAPDFGATTTTTATTPRATATGTATATATPSPTGTPASGASADEVVAAATKITGGREVSPLTAESCAKDNPDAKPCLELMSDAITVKAGIALFRGGYPDAGPFQLALAKAADGAWGVFYTTQQQAYPLTVLPGKLIACAPEDPLVIRAEPSANAEAVGKAARLEQLTAEEFTLTEAGAFGGRQRGHGWYRVSSPVAGWVPSQDTSAAAAGDCSLRDAIEGSTAHG